MNFGFTDEQEELASQVRKFLDNECSLDRVRELMASREPVARDLWAKMAELGWLGLAVPEADGGLGLGLEDVAVVAEELGRTLCPSPFIAHLAALDAVVRLGDDAQRARLLPAMMDGTSIGTLAVLEESDVDGPAGIGVAARAAGDGFSLSGKKVFVADGDAADLLLVAARADDGVGLFAVRADQPGVTREPLRLFDATQRASAVTLDGVQVARTDRLGAGDAWPTIEEVVRRARIAFAAETAGAASGALAMAVDYAKVREQFGSPIGRFQGVKHRCADLLVDVESARSLAYYAAYVADQEPADLRRVTAMALAQAAEAADRCGEECVQIHGAIGFTWECNAHLYYKRGRHARIAHGPVERQLDEVLAAQGL